MRRAAMGRFAAMLQVFVLTDLVSHNNVMSAFNLSRVHSESCFKTQDLSSERFDLTPNLVMFKFFSNETHSQVFHLPKCIFDSDLTTYLFQHINIYDDVTKYKSQFEKYYMASVEGSYKTIIVEGTDNTPYLDHNTAYNPEKTVKDLIVTYQDMKYMNPYPILSLIDDSPCEVFEGIDELILPYFGRCRKLFLNFDNVTVTGHVTSSFVTISYTAYNGTTPYTIRLFFGNSADVVHALPFESQDLAFRMMIHDDLEIIGHVNPVKSMLRTFKMDLLDSLLKQNHEDVTNDFKHLFSAFYSHIQKILRRDITRDSLYLEQLLEPLMTYGIAHYVQYRYKYTDKWRGIDNYLETETYMQMVPELFELFANNMTVINPVRPNATKFMDILLSVYLYKSSGPFDHRGLLIYFLKYVYQKNVTDDVATYAHEYMTKIYKKYTYPDTKQQETIYKSNNDSIDLFILNAIAVNSDNKTLRHHILLLQTGMCNIKNILGHFHALKHNEQNFGNLLSPCYRSLRYDLDEKKINELITTESLQQYGRLVSMVHSMTRNSSMLNIIKCELPEDGLLAIVPINDKLYVISSKPMVTGVVYKARYTAVNSFLFVTRVQNNTCVHIDRTFEDGTLKAVYSLGIDTAKECGDMCPSVLVEYGTNTGFIGLYTITTVDDLTYISSNRKLFPETSHYIWLLKNDTVLELEGTNIFLFSSRSPGAIILYIIIISLIIWTLYEIIKLFCYRRQWQYQKL
uniref:Envelope glycoprotein H n=4 Tax=Elephant endotheliotropic herpesvirus 1A TaxID=759753 RepID=A0A097IWP4_ELHV1|nr:envelope glycoprotein H [Elephant endotheliotropic herpesvirus 1A]QOE74832.1 envelope glycoprotein H [Elephant endotheliotropic herpesvirus 1A]QOE74948.1 envelope glycoprotein H [Elephant endotheliotropic herpesvirus 1A]